MKTDITTYGYLFFLILIPQLSKIKLHLSNWTHSTQNSENRPH